MMTGVLHRSAFSSARRCSSDFRKGQTLEQPFSFYEDERAKRVRSLFLLKPTVRAATPHHTGLLFGTES